MPVPDLTLRLEKGSELTFAEGDGDFTKLRDAIDALEETTLLAINQDGSLKNARVGYAADTGATDDYSVTISGSFTDISGLIGVVIIVKINTTNNGPSTLAVNGFAAASVKKNHALTLDHADLVAGKVALFLYNGTDFQLLNPRSNAQANYGVDVGAVNAYKIEFADLVALSISKFQMPDALYSGYRVALKASIDNTLASTLEIKIASPSTSIIGTIKRKASLDIIAGDIRAGYVYDLVWDGSNWILLNPSNGSQSYFTGDSTALSTTVNNASDAIKTFLHAFGSVPSRIRATLLCIANDNGYSVNDEVSVEGVRSATSNKIITGVWSDATNIGVVFGDNSFEVIPKTGGAYAVIDETKWKVRVRAWA